MERTFQRIGEIARRDVGDDGGLEVGGELGLEGAAAGRATDGAADAVPGGEGGGDDVLGEEARRAGDENETFG